MRYLTADELHRIVVLTQAGKSTVEISEIVGRSTRTVTRARSKMGIAQPVAKRMTPEDLAQAKVMLDDGCSQAEVARTLGFSGHCIAQHFPDQRWSHAEVVAFAVICRRNAEVLK